MRFYFDEDATQHQVIAALRSRGIEVETFLDADMIRQDDEDHLRLAASHGLVLTSCNGRDFAAIHQEWVSNGRDHQGILIIPQQRYSIGELIRRLVRASAARVNWRNGLLYLSNF